MHSWLTESYQKLAVRAQNKSLHHALLVKGLSGIGKQSFARSLSHYLLCSKPRGTQVCGQCQACLLVSASSHPDLHLIESEKQIGVDLIRENIQKLTGTAQLSGNKVLIILGADSMTESAANALLKTLEEPTPNTFLLLVCNDVQRMLPTILSRCEKIELNAPEISDCKAWLEQNGQANVSDSFIRIYANAPLLILEELEKEKGVSHRDFISGLEDIRSSNISASVLASSWQDSEKTVIKWLEHTAMKALRIKQNDDALWHLYSSCLKANSAIQNPGINKLLLVTGLLEQCSGIDGLLSGEQNFVG